MKKLIKQLVFVLCILIVILILRVGFTYIEENNKLANHDIQNNEITIYSKVEPVAIHIKIERGRDNIVGVEQPWPFLSLSEEVDEDLKNYAKVNEKGKFIYDNIDKLPNEQKTLLANNKDATEYIIGYIKNETVKYEEGETVKLGRRFPYYIQWDRRWAYQRLGEDDIAIGGCGPTSMAMIISGLKNDASITPDVIAKIEEDNGYYSEYGTLHSFFPFIAEYYDLQCFSLQVSKENMDKYIGNDRTVFLTLRPGRFTMVGHIVAVAGIDDNGNYLINDPNSLGRSLKSWSWDELENEISTMWTIIK